MNREQKSQYFLRMAKIFDYYGRTLDRSKTKQKLGSFEAFLKRNQIINQSREAQRIAQQVELLRRKLI